MVYKWEEFGFRLSITNDLSPKPGEALLIPVKAIIGGHFKFPSGCVLVSGLYLISSFSEKSEKNVKIEIEHCVLMGDMPENMHLCFVQSELELFGKQCNFTRVAKGGDFTSDHRYGKLIIFLSSIRPQLFGIVLVDRNKAKENVQPIQNEDYDYDQTAHQTAIIEEPKQERG